MVLPSSRSAFKRSITQAYLHEGFPYWLASFSNLLKMLGSMNLLRVISTKAEPRDKRCWQGKTTYPQSAMIWPEVVDFPASTFPNRVTLNFFFVLPIMTIEILFFSLKSRIGITDLVCSPRSLITGLGGAHRVYFLFLHSFAAWSREFFFLNYFIRGILTAVFETVASLTLLMSLSMPVVKLAGV